MSIEWRQVDGEPDYEVSNTGLVRRANTAKQQISTYRGRVLKVDTSTRYARVCLREKKLLVHRLVASAFIGKNLPYMHVNHRDGNTLNNHAENLEWATPKQNVHHAWANGLCRPIAGLRHGCAKLSSRDVNLIRSGLLNGVKANALARMFDVSEATISQIKHNKSRSLP
jgi:hypothetical protein